MLCSVCPPFTVNWILHYNTNACFYFILSACRGKLASLPLIVSIVMYYYYYFFITLVLFRFPCFGVAAKPHGMRAHRVHKCKHVHFQFSNVFIPFCQLLHLVVCWVWSAATIALTNAISLARYQPLFQWIAYWKCKTINKLTDTIGENEKLKIDESPFLQSRSSHCSRSAGLCEREYWCNS